MHVPYVYRMQRRRVQADVLNVQLVQPARQPAKSKDWRGAGSCGAIVDREDKERKKKRRGRRQSNEDTGKLACLLACRLV